MADPPARSATSAVPDGPPGADPADTLGWLLPGWALWTGRTAVGHLPLVLAAAAFAAFILKVLRVCRGDPAVALEVLAVSDKAQVALGSAALAAPSALSGLTALAVLAAARACGTAARARRNVRGAPFDEIPLGDRRVLLATAMHAAATVLAAVVLFALLALTAPWPNTVLPLLALLLRALFGVFAKRMRAPIGRGESRASAFIADHPSGVVIAVAAATVVLFGGLVLQLMYALLNDRMWLPPHAVTLQDGSRWVGYQLADTDGRRTYLRAQDRIVVVVDADNVVSEDLCSAWRLRDTRPLVDIGRAPRAATAACPGSPAP